jgi:hypothetical protein
MAYGVKICGATDYNEYGVVLNLNIFSGDEMLEKFVNTVLQRPLEFLILMKHRLVGSFQL